MIFLPFLLIFSLTGLIEGQECDAVGHCPIVENVLNIHLIPHSHDDTGYRKTVEQVDLLLPS